VPATVSMVACGSRRTAILSHTGRLYVYSGMSQQAPTPPSTAKNSRNILWQTVHTNLTSHPEVNLYASALICHRDPHKILNMFAVSRSTPSLQRAHLQFQLQQTERLQVQADQQAIDRQQKGLESGDRMSLNEYLRQLEKQLKQEREEIEERMEKSTKLSCASWTKILQRCKSLMPAKISMTANPNMSNLIDLIHIMNRIYMACHSIYPTVREEAVSV